MTEEIPQLEKKGGAKQRTELLNKYLYDSKNKSYFVAAVTIIFALLLVVLGVIPSFSSVLSQNKENGKIDEVIDQAETKLAILNSLVQEKDNNPKVVESLNAALPNGIDQENIMTELYGFIVNNNGYFSSITFPDNGSGEQEFLQSLNEISEKVQVALINVNFEASRADAINILREIGNSQRVYNVRNYSMSKRSEEDLLQLGEDRAFDVNMTLETYYWDDSITSDRIEGQLEIDVVEDIPTESNEEQEGDPSSDPDTTETDTVEEGVEQLEPGLSF